jgi:propanediol dehydratase small subunit
VLGLIPGVSELNSLRRGVNAAKEAGVVANGIRGRASEARVLNELGLTKNTTAVSTAEGRSIPDALTKSLSVEVKDAANVSLTRQLRIQTEAARASGRESVLITGENTCVSGACSRAFDTIIRRPDLGPR